MDINKGKRHDSTAMSNVNRGKTASPETPIGREPNIKLRQNRNPEREPRSNRPTRTAPPDALISRTPIPNYHPPAPCAHKRLCRD